MVGRAWRRNRGVAGRDGGREGVKKILCTFFRCVYRRAVSAGTNGIAGRGGGSVAMAASRSYFMCSRTLSIAAAMMYILVSDGQILKYRFPGSTCPRWQGQPSWLEGGRDYLD